MENGSRHLKTIKLVPRGEHPVQTFMVAGLKPTSKTTEKAFNQALKTTKTLLIRNH